MSIPAKFDFNFETNTEDWDVIFLDYPDYEGVEEFYELEFIRTTLFH